MDECCDAFERALNAAAEDTQRLDWLANCKPSDPFRIAWVAGELYLGEMDHGSIPRERAWRLSIDAAIAASADGEGS